MFISRGSRSCNSPKAGKEESAALGGKGARQGLQGLGLLKDSAPAEWKAGEHRVRGRPNSDPSSNGYKEVPICSQPPPPKTSKEAKRNSTRPVLYVAGELEIKLGPRRQALAQKGSQATGCEALGRPEEGGREAAAIREPEQADGGDSTGTEARMGSCRVCPAAACSPPCAPTPRPRRAGTSEPRPPGASQPRSESPSGFFIRRQRQQKQGKGVGERRNRLFLQLLPLPPRITARRARVRRSTAQRSGRGELAP
ncbi:uncharacterized protein LOC132539720 [Erinaceus europaeus]|uniref:Uncharacterized protein LOC132539720 n=1 Tax=Erinaceus europaeus TaxID=9365 RepID=A0ABM3XS41_ERIEU|nr:uncharacterized protein LOC132539720 [Erinaceus europaeus]